MATVVGHKVGILGHRKKQKCGKGLLGHINDEPQVRMAIYDMMQTAQTNYEVVQDILRVYGKAKKMEQRF